MGALSAAAVPGNRRAIVNLLIGASLVLAALFLALLGRGKYLLFPTSLFVTSPPLPESSTTNAGSTQSIPNSPFVHGGSLRAVLLQSDTRKVADDFSTAEYGSLTAAINYAYAKRHGYSFVRIELTVNSYVHPLLKHTRMMGWGKLPLWWAATQDSRFDWVVGLDSDAFISEQDVPLERFPAEFLRGQPYWGALPGEGALTLMRDSWYANDFILESGNQLLDLEPGNPDPDAYCSKRYANTGFALMRSGPVSEMLLRRWWDVNDPVRTAQWSFEQDAVGVLWRAGGSVRGNVTVACSKHHGFFKPSTPGQWVRHIVAPQSRRTEIVRNFALSIGINATVYNQLVAEMRSSGTLKTVDEAAFSAITQDMAARSSQAAGGATFDPHCGGDECSCVHEGRRPIVCVV